MVTKKEEKEEQIRERWIAVVDKLQGEKDEMDRDIVRRLESIEKLLQVYNNS